MHVLQITLVILSVLLFIAVTLPFVRHDYWVFRILEYPRFQKFILCLVVLTCWVPVADLANPLHIGSMIAMALCCGYLLYKIFPYTSLSRREMKTVKQGDRPALKIFAANVYEENRQYSRVLSQISQTDPDLVFLVETDQDWAQGVASLHQKYPHTLEKPLGNTYGLLFFSRLKLRDAEVKFLVTPEVPSIETIAVLPSGEEIRIFGLHPKPPVPGEDERSTAKDKELILVAEKAARSTLPVIVMGDLNDVAWSYTTELFRKTSHLLDPRRGRGFYSTFNAKNTFMRFPLDYIFCSNHFGLVRMKRMPKNGSDHFAMYIELCLDPSLQAVQPVPHADEKEKKQAEEKKQGS
jgi:endonuclease/exonuclease/phosphatase (EEP) superfamily protein YafD